MFKEYSAILRSLLDLIESPLFSGIFFDRPLQVDVHTPEKMQEDSVERITLTGKNLIT
jgi:hypothetical protein